MAWFKNIRDVWNKFQFILTRSQKRWGLVVIFMTIIGALFETVGISIILPLVQVMISPDVIWENKYARTLIDFVHITTDAQLITAIGTAVIFIYIGKNIFLLLLSYIRVKYACKVQRELSIEMMKSYMGRGYSFFLGVNTGEILRGMTTSIYNTFYALLQIMRIAAELLTVFCICVFIMATDMIMAVCMMFLSVVCLIIVANGFRRWMKVCGENNHKYTAIINKLILNAFEGIKEVLVMKRQRFFIREYEKNYLRQQGATIGQTVASESPAFLIEGVCVVGVMAVVCYRGIHAVNPEALVPQLASFAIAAFRILPSLGRISSYFNQFMYCIPSLHDTYSNFREVRSNPSNFSSSNTDKDAENISFEKELALKNITWRYVGSETNVLEGMDLVIKKGKSVALIGQSGAGKTTLSDIILGLLMPQKGCVAVDGVSIYDIPYQWSRMIGFVPQTIYLSDDTIRKNVAFGLPDAEIKDELVWNALEQAQIKDFVIGLPEGLDTRVGEKGIRFSGGQRQRLAIARALYYDPEIMILDEATSALDSDTETSVMEAMERLHGKKTLIIVAHRLSTIKKCDEIYEVVNGKAVSRDKKEIFGE